MEKVTQANLPDHQLTHDKSNSWWENDARGIPLCRVCEDCREVALSRYKPEVLSGRGYEEVVEERIEED
jgi:hypothetical protein